MGRPPCCDKIGVKKGPWTPEEDILLVTYVQQHGPGNWKNVPSFSGLRRCSKSCRLRWANYLRPGIKRGGFTDQEEKMIIQLQALLGNKWAAIASYLPERTDNDIKNYWNTHLKKKLHKHQQNINGSSSSQHSSISTSSQWQKTLQTDINKAKQALNNALSMDTNNTNITPTESVFSHTSTYTYASSTENIARLLKDWEKNPNKCEKSKSLNSSRADNSTLSEESKAVEESFESLFGCLEYSSSSSNSQGESKPADDLSLTMLEKWLFDEDGDNQGKDDLPNFSFDDHQNMF